MDEGLFYNVTSVVVRLGLTVAYRSLAASGRQQVEDKTPIHIADVQTMTDLFLVSCETSLLVITTTAVVVSRRWLG